MLHVLQYDIIMLVSTEPRMGNKMRATVKVTGATKIIGKAEHCASSERHVFKSS